MTKEKLRDKLFEQIRDREQDEYIDKTLDEFFAQNICIPKGENRHPYADVFHAIAEGIPVQTRECDALLWYVPNDFITPASHPSNQWRIKPPEPIYEWQWRFTGFLFGKDMVTENYHTDEEMHYGKNNFEKIESTKQERK